MTANRPMTNFKIPDTAVENACSAYNVNAGLGYSIADRDCMRAAIEAALPVMFELIGFTNQEELYELIAGRGGWISGLELDGDTVTLYRLKEPK